MEKVIKDTISQLRSAMQIEPIHADLTPVKSYAREITNLKSEQFSVVSVPKGTAAHGMGYRFVCIPNSELDYYISNGATLIE